MSNVPRLISATGSQIEKFSPMDLKQSILKSEGRVICGQHLLFGAVGFGDNSPGIIRDKGRTIEVQG